VASSSAHVHWIDPAPVQTRHGAGIGGEVVFAGRITTCSIVRGAWEVRLIRIDALESDGARLRIGGWALAGEPGEVVATASEDAASARLGDLTSALVALTPGLDPRVERRQDASPLGPDAAVPVLTTTPEKGRWIAAAVQLSGDAAGGAGSAASAPALTLEADAATVVWPDGLRTTSRLPSNED